MTKIYGLNTGGTLGMIGNPLRPAKSAEELFEGVKIPTNMSLTLEDFPERQDSTNIRHADRIKFATMIEANYADHDAFVILHGTDSLAETTAALCMIFKDSLQKPLFVVGAQMTKEESGSEVTMQLENTFRVAAAFLRHNIVGVYNVSISDVWDGSRLRKSNESDYNAFYTPGRNAVAHARPNIVLQHELLRALDSRIAVQGLRLDTGLEERVASIRVSADTPPDILDALTQNSLLTGIILECKGAGNIPDRNWDESGSSWIDAIQRATTAGVHVAILSPFDDGRVNLERYELGAKAKKAGALSLGSLTPDMADIKFRMAIAMYPDNPEQIERYLLQDLIGEMLPGIEDI